ncbi:DtxR family iron (metal) dependent repressor [Methanomicrobiaceae archaeon CYW5]|uniref:metal-dependent transcriptional regulator n=1 Tax=Methanovulcanius yangii TaxID=1789227 RepID=UPI0029CA08FC|nr:metal-dependent transcriptional regulator [Methanovulcanius yangii]MBT8508322.1 DtxR family iron (metal) dependent repressor [Methanovulcanius yangii]
MYSLSRKAEDYLEAILNVILEKGYARTKDVAGDLGVSPSSVVEMFRKLDAMHLVEYRKYEGVTLTEKGRAVAEVIKFRHDTLKRLFLLLGVSERAADEDACLMEHELSEESIRRIRLFVDFLDSPDAPADVQGAFEAFCRGKAGESGGK